MIHFSHDEWELFKEGVCPEKLHAAMEEHLVHCDRCRELFLSLISEEDITKGRELLSPDFSRQVMKGIKGQDKERPARKKNSRFRQRKNTPVYFAAAAAITLILMGGGFFQSLVQSVPQFSTEAAIVDHHIFDGVRMDWPNKLVDRTSNWIYDFETQDKGGL
ncbi:MAG: hypothetical protein AAGU27_07060 [Dehalobacterium sp.]